MSLTVPADPDERRALALSLIPEMGALIGDSWRSRLSGGTRTHVDPSTGLPTMTFCLSGARDVEDAMTAACEGLAAWRSTPSGRRSALLRALGAAIRDAADELALLTTLETGMAFEISRYRMGITPTEWFEHYAGWCDKFAGDTLPCTVPGEMTITLHEPVGVVAKLVTWNSPIGGIQMSVPAALAAGCSVVIKPPELAPFAITRFGQLCQEVGFPPGVIGILPAGPEGSDLLVRHRAVAKVSFTGGPATARAIQRAASDGLTSLVLELGGKSALVVFADADLQKAIGQAAMVCGLAGQGCALPTRLLVHEDVYDEVVAGVVAALSSIVIGDPFDSATFMGPLITEESLERVLGMVDRAVAAGATLAAGGGRAGGNLARGWFIEPTVLVDVAPDSEIAQVEVFGPVISVLKFRDEDEAVALANGTGFGLVAYLHTCDLSRAMRLMQRLEAGTVCINGSIAPTGSHSPFGGVKNSGYGREGGREGIVEFSTLKTVNITL